MIHIKLWEPDESRGIMCRGRVYCVNYHEIEEIIVTTLLLARGSFDRWDTD